MPITVGGPEAKTSSSSDSCVKPDLSSLDTNPEVGNKSSSPSSEIGAMYIGEYKRKVISKGMAQILQRNLQPSLFAHFLFSCI